MMHRKIYDVLIIGAGPAGISAAIWCQRFGLHAKVLEQNTHIGGQLHEIHNKIIDYAGVIAANGTELKRLFEEHLDQLDISIRTHCKVNRITRNSDLTLTAETDQSTFHSKYVLIASGSQERLLHIPGEQQMRARGEIYSSKKDLGQLKDKRVLIVGGGDRALEGACNIAPVAQSVQLVHRSAQFRARQEFMSKVSEFPNVHIMTNTIIEAIHGNDRVEAITLCNLANGNREKIETDAVLMRIGREPAQQFVPPEIMRTGDGFIVVDTDGRTNIDCIFAIGDLVNRPQISSIATSVGQGMRAISAIMDELKKDEGTSSLYGNLS